MTESGSGGNPTERRTLKATFAEVSVARLTMVLTGLGVVVALVFGVASSCGTDEAPAQSGVGNTYCTNESTCDVDVTQAQTIVRGAEAEAGEDDTELRRLLGDATGASEPPDGSGPFPYLVVDTGELGLFARTTNVISADRVGFAGNRSMVWVDCVARSDFTPEVSAVPDVGPRWALVRWKHRDGGQVMGLSEPNESQTAWMYLGALAPVGHNGDVPDC